MKAVTLGEIMLRLMPPGFRRLLQAETFEAEYGGAEANVAVALAVWGEEAKFVSKVPANGWGRRRSTNSADTAWIRGKFCAAAIGWVSIMRSGAQTGARAILCMTA